VGVLRRSRAPRLLDRLQAAWCRSDEIFRLVPEDALLERPISLRQPFLFYLGHLPAFAWNKVCRGTLGMSGFVPSFDLLFERGIDPVDVEDYHPGTAPEWPPVADVLRYRDRIRQALEEAYLDAESRPEAERTVFEMVLEHELMHQETLLYMVQQLPRSRRASSAHSPSAPRLRGAAAPGLVSILRGTATLGAVRGTLPYGWDNEFEAHTVDVPAFVIDATPVRNGEYLAFVEAGGYRRRDLWSEEAWIWREARGIDHPSFWSRADGHWRCRALFHDLPLNDVLDWPAYVTWVEAQAFLAWRSYPGKSIHAGSRGAWRLPTEAEFHRAAYGSAQNGRAAGVQPWGDAAATPRYGNFGFSEWGPTPVGAYPAGASGWGVQDLVGNGWEWTGTPFAPFPGFVPHPAYPEYSRDFFDGRHYVMLGASWATDVALIRRSFRNWFQAHYPYAFAKFRGVSPG